MNYWNSFIVKITTFPSELIVEGGTFYLNHIFVLSITMSPRLVNISQNPLFKPLRLKINVFLPGVTSQTEIYSDIISNVLSGNIFVLKGCIRACTKMRAIHEKRRVKSKQQVRSDQEVLSMLQVHQNSNIVD